MNSALRLHASALSSRRPAILSVASATPAVYLRRVQRIHVNPEHLISSAIPIKMILIIGIITFSYCSLLSITFLRSEWNIFFHPFFKIKY